jgi:hypothetical protein
MEFGFNYSTQEEDLLREFWELKTTIPKEGLELIDD